MSAARRKLLVADKSLGVGLAAIGGAVWLWPSRPTTSTGAHATLDARAVPAGAAALVTVAY